MERQDIRIVLLILAGLILLTLALSEDVTQLAQAHVSAVILDWLFLVAQGIWFGGAAYLGFVLLPLLPALEPELHARSLVTLIQRSTPLIAGSIGCTACQRSFSCGNEPEQCSTIIYRSLWTRVAGENNTCRDNAAFERLHPVLSYASATQAGYVVTRRECRDASKTHTPGGIGAQ